MVKREENSLRNLIAVGIDDALSKKLLKKGYTKSKLQKAFEIHASRKGRGIALSAWGFFPSCRTRPIFHGQGSSW
jgi:hypothetical protein